MASIDAVGADLVAVHEQGGGAALANAAAVVGVLHPDLAGAGRERFVGGHGPALHGRHVHGAAEGAGGPEAHVVDQHHQHILRPAGGRNGSIRGKLVSGSLAS
jgi:hypothetical protein